MQTITMQEAEERQERVRAGAWLTLTEMMLTGEGERGEVRLTDGGLLRGPSVVRWSSVANVADVVAVRGGESLADLGSDPEVSALRRRSDVVEGKELVTEGGEKIGEVSDLLVDDLGGVLGYEVKSGLVRDLMGRKFLPIEGVRSSGGDVVIASSAGLPSVDDVVRR